MLGALALVTGCSVQETQLPGVQADGTVLLPSGWLLSPAGTQVEVGELPLNMDLSSDGRVLLVTNNGTGNQSVSVIDVPSWKVVAELPVARSWLGIRYVEKGRLFALSGGNDNRVLLYDIRDTTAERVDSVVLGEPWPKERISIAGMDTDEPTRSLYVCTREDNTLCAIDLASRSVRQRIALGTKPYTCLVSRHHPYVFVSLWGGATVRIFHRGTLGEVASIRVGDHPSDMAESPDGRRLFVANANHNTVSVIDIERLTVTETLSSALAPDLPPGSTPNSVAVSGDGRRLFIANADNNYLAVMDITHEGETRALGFIPTGWYPTCVRVSRDGTRLFVANGKGSSSRPNPNGPNPQERAQPYEEYIGRMFRGTLSSIPVPDERMLTEWTAQVYRNSRTGHAPARADAGGEPNPVPLQKGETSPIKYVFYVIKENRTYDQVFGDMPQGNGDSTLCLFPDRVTPNHHALAREFVLLDNFYCDAEVSADGHQWSMGAYANDYVEKTWPTLYGGRGGEHEYEGGTPIASPCGGYLWDNCRRHNVSYRSYGEFAENGPTLSDTVRAADEGLVGHVAPFYRSWDLSYSDVLRAEAWMREFDEFERRGDLPRLQIIKLPNDHTEGTRAGSLTPRAFVAQNDLALGMIVERISRSRFWRESAIFVIEDDAQNGPDHVDAHRTVALVISPYVKRGFVDSELYSTSSMVRTMELILGLPPMSQFDATAKAMANSFTMDADATPYVLRRPGVDIEERNPAAGYGQRRSGEMDFSREDAIPDIELNEIIWKSIRGPASTMPAPVRSAFVFTARADDDD